MATEQFQEWVMLELMGHRRLFGLLQETDMPGSLYRIDIYVGDAEDPDITQFYSVDAVYCITPMSENLVRQMAAKSQVRPVAVYELPLYSGNDPNDEDM